jgi:SAM-dependent methyltransferase
MKCRHCETLVTHTFLDLGFAPPSNAYLTADDLVHPEKNFPLKIKVCGECWLVQTEDYAQADELFSHDYAYFSSTSTGWLMHAELYAKAIIDQLGLTQKSFVIEVASNDGYLLKNFIAADIPCLGIEPTASTAAAAEKLGIPVLHEFFSETLGNLLAVQGNQADLIVGNNVYAHVPDINDFTRGLKAALKPDGTITLEFPHLLQLVEQNQFDTVYHEHFSYFSLNAIVRIFKAADLRVFDVSELSSHGGSLRVFGCHKENHRTTKPSVDAILLKERECGLESLATYSGFQTRADQVKDNLLSFLIEQKRVGKKVVAYGAAAKGNTLLNYAGVKPDLLAFVCDAAPSKQGKFLPGSHIPILPPFAIYQNRPDFVLILPWNLADEVIEANLFIREWGGKFITAVPKLQII